MKGQLRIETMYAFICLDDDGTEGVPAFESLGVMYPLMGADSARVESYKPMAQYLAKIHKKKVTLCRFSVREELEVFEP